MAIQHISREGGIQGLRLKTDSGRPVTIYAAEPGKYNLGKASHVRQVGVLHGNITVDGNIKWHGTTERRQHRMYGGPDSRAINIASGGNLQIEVPDQSDAAFAVYDFDDQ